MFSKIRSSGAQQKGQEFTYTLVSLCSTLDLSAIQYFCSCKFLFLKARVLILLARERSTLTTATLHLLNSHMENQSYWYGCRKSS